MGWYYILIPSFYRQFFYFFSLKNYHKMAKTQKLTNLSVVIDGVVLNKAEVAEIQSSLSTVLNDFLSKKKKINDFVIIGNVRDYKLPVPILEGIYANISKEVLSQINLRK